MPRRTAVGILLLAAALFAAWWAYHPGLAGTFLFDDFKNLNAIGSYGRIDSLQKLLLYLSSGDADPTGRPLSLLSFLLDADDWPADPYPFKRTNILLHLVNGLLLAWLLLRLGRRARLAESHATAAAALAALCWTLHPLWVSTTLYVVQRQAMMAATFCLAGLLLWVAGRERFVTRPWSGATLMFAGAWGCTALAVLSKGNGVILPVLIWVTDSIVLEGGERLPPNPRPLRMLRLLLLKLPALAIALWLGNVFRRGLLHPAADIQWDTWHRLITQPRALLDYLLRLWIPRGSLGGLLNDDYRASLDLLHPWSTLPAILAVGALLAAGFGLRRRQPLLALAILFFFAGHLIESTVMPLELYFEHRNYLPAAPMFWPLAVWLTGTAGLPLLRKSLILAIPLFLLLLTHARATLWGKPYELAVAFAQASPHSPRAQVTAGYYHLANGHPLLAVARLRATLEEFPDEALAGVHLIEAECALGELMPATRVKVLRAIGTNANEAAIIHYWMDDQIARAASQSCRGFDLDYMEQMLAAARGNPHFMLFPTHGRDIEHMAGRLALARGNAAAALEHFNRSLAQDPGPSQALEQAALLASAGSSALALQHLQYFKTLPKPPPAGFTGMPWVHDWLLQHSGYWTAELAELERKLREDQSAAAQQPAVPRP
ncbi:MAG: tetratricopeptide repeat protein [Nevskia sp.]|nr:tetratricopeptide repeat protein [Nevskia sp.]